MIAPLQNIFDKLEKQRAFIIHKTSEMTVEKYHFAPLNKWSVGQILTHLLTSERLALVYMKKKVLGLEIAENSGFFDNLKMQVLKVSQRIPFRYRAPQIIVDNTPKELPLEEVVLEWNQIRSELKNLAESIADKSSKKKIFKHPFMGRLNLIQGLTFIHEHIGHHWPQIKRLL